MDVQQIHTARVKPQEITGESGSLVDKRLGSIPLSPAASGLGHGVAVAARTAT